MKTQEHNIESLGKDHYEDQYRDLVINKKVRVFFQPIVNVKNGTILSLEALCRCSDDSEFKDKAPFACLDTKHHLDLDKVCLEQIIEMYLRNNNNNNNCNAMPPLFINCLLENMEFLGDMDLSVFERRKIIIELDLNHEVFDVERILGNVADLKAKSFSIAIDDIGERHFDFQLIDAIAPSFIKVDIGQIKGISEDAKKQEFLKDIVAYSMKTGTTVIAEGIESGADLNKVRELGCYYVQGYLFARPSQLIPDENELRKVVGEQLAG